MQPNRSYRNNDDEEYGRDWPEDTRSQRTGQSPQNEWNRDSGQRQSHSSDREGWRSRQQDAPYRQDTPYREDYSRQGRNSPDFDYDRERSETGRRSAQWRDQGERSGQGQRQDREGWRSTNEPGGRNPRGGSREDRYSQDEDRPYYRGGNYRSQQSPAQQFPSQERGWFQSREGNRSYEEEGYPSYEGGFQSREGRGRSSFAGQEGLSSPGREYQGSGGSMGYERSGMQGPYTGKGPKGYKRSDDRVKEEVCDRLERQGDIDASEIEVVCKDGVVTLRGTVEDRSMKRKAEESVAKMYGVSDVMNELRVGQTRSSDASERSSERASASSGTENERQKTGTATTR